MNAHVDSVAFLAQARDEARLRYLRTLLAPSPSHFVRSAAEDLKLAEEFYCAATEGRAPVFGRRARGRGKNPPRRYNALIVYTVSDIGQTLKQEAKRRGVSFSALAGAILREVVEEGMIDKLVGEEFPVPVDSKRMA